MKVLLEGLLLHFGLFNERFDVVFWFWIGGRGSGSKLREKRLLRGILFNRNSWVLSTVLFWDGDGLFWHMLGWRSKIAWTRCFPVSSLMGLVNIDPRRSITVLSERVVYSFWLVRLLSLVVHIWPDDVDVVDVLSTVTTLSWLVWSNKSSGVPHSTAQGNENWWGVDDTAWSNESRRLWLQRTMSLVMKKEVLS